MEETNTVSPEYRKRFNEGYALAKYLPEVAEILAQSLKENERGNGFRDGHRQFLNEQSKDKRPAWLSGHRPAKEQKQPDRNKDRDMEPD
ncbi:MAG: hypothetical protein U0X91_03270 [Spirosomataceae bacterium]